MSGYTETQYDDWKTDGPEYLEWPETQIRCNGCDAELEEGDAVCSECGEPV